MTARALARHYAALIGPGVDGVRLLPAARVATATDPLPEEPDVVWGITAAQGLGYLLGGPRPIGVIYDVSGNGSAFGHHGMGGAIGYADPEHGLAVGIVLTTPRGGGPEARLQIAGRIQEVLGVPQHLTA
jgi:CubicO group peptidase (beta-lactamase class C family)